MFYDEVVMILFFVKNIALYRFFDVYLNLYLNASTAMMLTLDKRQLIQYYVPTRNSYVTVYMSIRQINVNDGNRNNINAIECDRRGFHYY